VEHTKLLACNKFLSLLCACVQFQHYSLHCFDVSVDVQKLVKNKGVPLLFFSSVLYGKRTEKRVGNLCVSGNRCALFVVHT
jgi:hypothetical protein